MCKDLPKISPLQCEYVTDERDEESPTNDMDGTSLQPKTSPLAATPLTADTLAPKKKKWTVRTYCSKIACMVC